MDFVAAKPAIIIPVSRELLVPDRKLIVPAISFISSGRFGGAAAFGSTFIGSAVDAVQRATYTFTSQGIGAADATRRVIVGIGVGLNTGGATVNSVTIGGVAATVHAAAGANQHSTAFASLLVPTGTTATIVINGNWGASNQFTCGIGIYRQVSESVASPNATMTDNIPSGSTYNGTINIPSGGAMYGVAKAINSTYTWSGATGFASAYNQVITGTETHSGAFGVPLTANPTATLQEISNAQGCLSGMTWI